MTSKARPPHPAPSGSAVAERHAMFAADLGGTRIKTALVSGDSAGNLTATAITATSVDHDALAQWERLAREHKRSWQRIGLAVPGIIDEGSVRALPGKHAGLAGVDLIAESQRRCGVVPTVVNDAVAAAVGESTAGAGRGVERLLVMTIGTGVGVCVLDHGRPVGSGPLAGGILGGHIPFTTPRDRADSNGQHDTIEAACCAAALLDFCDNSYSDIASLLVAADEGEASARAGLQEYRVELSRAIVGLVHAHGVERVVVGGGPLATSAHLIDGVEAAVNARLFGDLAVTVRRAELGDAAALIGLAAIANWTP